MSRTTFSQKGEQCDGYENCTLFNTPIYFLDQPILLRNHAILIPTSCINYANERSAPYVFFFARFPHTIL